MIRFYDFGQRVFTGKASFVQSLNFLLQTPYILCFLVPPAIVTDACDNVRNQLLAMQKDAGLKGDAEQRRDIAEMTAYFEKTSAGYELLEHFTISWNNIKTTVVGFVTILVTLQSMPGL